MGMRKKLAISLVAGLLALTLWSTPAWWGVLFSPVTRQLTCASLAEDRDGFWRWEVDGVVVRLKSLDLLFSLLGIEPAGHQG